MLLFCHNIIPSFLMLDDDLPFFSSEQKVKKKQRKAVKAG
jgi:hypothetical protein